MRRLLFLDSGTGVRNSSRSHGLQTNDIIRLDFPGRNYQQLSSEHQFLVIISLSHNSFQIGFDITTGANSTKQQTVGAEAIIDAVVTNTPIFIRSSTASAGSLKGSLVLNNIKLNNVPIAVGLVGGATVLAGGTTTIASWGQGDVYTGTSGTKSFIQGNIPAPHKSHTLLDSAGRIFGKTRPQYAAYSVSQFVSARDQGAKGDGNTDDTQAINSLLSKVRTGLSVPGKFSQVDYFSMLDAKSFISTPVHILW